LGVVQFLDCGWWLYEYRQGHVSRTPRKQAAGFLTGASAWCGVTARRWLLPKACQCRASVTRSRCHGCLPASVGVDCGNAQGGRPRESAPAPNPALCRSPPALGLALAARAVVHHWPCGSARTAAVSEADALDVLRMLARVGCTRSSCRAHTCTLVCRLHCCGAGGEDGRRSAVASTTKDSARASIEYMRAFRHWETTCCLGAGVT
jgi:hypothetical protein